jgi:hypothetical protein
VYKGHRGKTPHCLNLGSRYRWHSSCFTPSTHCGHWVVPHSNPSGCGGEEKNCPNQELNPRHSDLCQSHYSTQAVTIQEWGICTKKILSPLQEKLSPRQLMRVKHFPTLQFESWLLDSMKSHFMNFWELWGFLVRVMTCKPQCVIKKINHRPQHAKTNLCRMKEWAGKICSLGNKIETKIRRLWWKSSYLLQCLARTNLFNPLEHSGNCMYHLP